MNENKAKLLLRYGGSIGCAAVAFTLAMTVEYPWVALSPFLLFYAAVALSSWYGGTGPGLLATLLGTLSVQYYLLEPTRSLRIDHPRDITRLVVFTFVGALIASLNGALRRAKNRCQLEAHAARASESRARFNEERLRQVSAELMMAEERERRRIATVLHDAVGQMLALAKLKVDTLRRTSTNGDTARISEVYLLIDDAITQTRTLTADISPPVLYELGLAAAIQWLGDRIRSEHGIAFDLTGDRQRTPLTDEARIVIFQAVRELLMNVVKHARASTCWVRITRDTSAIRVVVEDDGKGFVSPVQQDYSKGGFGLFNIRQRLDHLGGQLTIEPRPGRGTVVTITAPLAEPARQEVTS